jgi:ClpP class serine protease
LKTSPRGRISVGVDVSTGEVWLGTRARALGPVAGIGTLEEVIRNERQLASYDFGPRRLAGPPSVDATSNVVATIVDRAVSGLRPRFRYYVQ